MHDRGFRFGVVAGRPASGAAALDTARRAEALGYDVLLVPDTRFTPSPFPALAAAGAVTSVLRLGTWVLAAPLRTPGALVREAEALQALSDGRLELGIGAGRPDGEQDAAAVGAAWGTGGERVDRVLELIGAVRGRMRAVPPIAVAAAGPRLVAAAGRLADTVALALPPLADLGRVAAAADRVREHGDPELALGVVAVGGEPVSHLARQGVAAADLAAAATAFAGDARRAADQVRALREATGVSYLAVAEEHAGVFAPVIGLLRG